jgi:protein phosphatase
MHDPKKFDYGAFDIIGDIHGCFEELHELLLRLGYTIDKDVSSGNVYEYIITPPAKRKVVFLGDLVDRGPDSMSVLKLVMSMVNGGSTYCVMGNHDFKFQKFLNGKRVQLKNGLDVTVRQLEREPPAFRQLLRKFLNDLSSHLILNEGELVVSHAGIKEEMIGRQSGAVQSFCLFGDTTGEMDEFGLPVRRNWAKNYHGNPTIVYGHTPVREPLWINGTINIDTGCVFGGKLTALRYPEKELVSVKAKQLYCPPPRPFL